MAEQTCACAGSSVLVFPCSGGSNVGQIANAAAVELARQGVAKMYCLAGVAAHIPGMVDSAGGAELRIAIDGCGVACARKALEHAGISVDHAVVVTELGIAKSYAMDWSPEHVRQVASASLPPRT